MASRTLCGSGAIGARQLRDEVRRVAAARQELDVGAEVDAHSAHGVGERSQPAVDVAGRVGADDDRHFPANEFIDAQIVGVAAIGQIPVPSPRPGETAGELGQQTRLRPESSA